MSAVAKTKIADTPQWPHNGWERFKYTNIDAAVKNLTLHVAVPRLVVSASPFVFTGRMNNAPEWARAVMNAVPAGDAQYRDMVLWRAAHDATTDIVVIDIPANTDAGAIVFDHKGENGMSATPRLVVRLGSGASLTLRENMNGTGQYWHNGLMQIDVAANARLRHVRVNAHADAAVHTHNTHITIGRDGSYEAFTLTTGGALTRNQIHAELRGDNAEVRLAGINLLDGSRHGDTTITIEHAAPHCRSNQTYKSIITDKARGVFQGKVHVHQVAQKTDGYQLSNALLLSKTAVMDTKPELEIYADDVKCSHGATTGQLDMAPLFYLRTRGLSEADAKMLLMQAFLGPALDEIRDEAARDDITDLAFNWLEAKTRG